MHPGRLCSLLLVTCSLVVGVGAAVPRTADAAEEVTWTPVVLEHAGRTRSAHLLARAGRPAGVRVPLVLALHGGGGDGPGLRRNARGQFERQVRQRGWLVVFPDGVARGWNDGRPLTSARDRERADVDDVAYLDALVDHLVATASADPDRVYAVGISNGGFLAIRLGLERGARYAAVGAVTASLPEVHVQRGAVPGTTLVMVNGTEDPLVPYAGGEVRVLGKGRGRILGTEATATRWAAALGLSTTPRETSLPDRRPWDGTRVVERRFAEEGVAAEVVLYRVEGGGHTWPGGGQYLPRALIGRTSRDVAGADLVFEVFARHRRPAATVGDPTTGDGAAGAGDPRLPAAGAR